MDSVHRSVAPTALTRQLLSVTAIAFHKFVINFCVCLELQQNRVKNSTFYSYLTVFSLTSSSGIGIGILVTQLQGGNRQTSSGPVAVVVLSVGIFSQ